MYTDRICHLFIRSLTEPMKEITDKEIKSAKKILYRFNAIYDTNHLFLVLSAINLLNAAIKKKEYKKKLGYSLIKTKASLLLELLIKGDSMNCVTYYYNAEEKCMYVKVYGVIFSFHNISESDIILNTAPQNIIEWTGIKLQAIPIEVFELAKKLNNI